MDYQITSEAAAACARISGQIRAQHYNAFRELARDLGGSAAHEWVLDLSEVEEIDAAGYGLLLIMREEALKARARLVLRKPRGEAVRIFDIAQRDKAFQFSV